jgi:hypothetical protein
LTLISETGEPSGRSNRPAATARRLATLAKDHPFTFLDHSLRCGDSLVGLTRKQISEFHWNPDQRMAFGQQFIQDRIRDATTYRQEILDNVIAFAFSTDAGFASVQSQVHELWVRFFASSMKDDVRYTPSDCFLTFPFPPDFESDVRLGTPEKEYYDFRAALMVKSNEGLTKTYNRFHDPAEKSAEILRLAELHAVMDRAVLDAYGWGAHPDWL